jgi:ADP-L-glycero-D-manno-heptose 6-epimerase
VATASINACRRAEGGEPLTLEALHRAGSIEYIALPQGLAEKYQSFTQADIGRLRAAGYAKPFMGIDEGVPHCIRTLLAQSRVNE